MPRHPESPHAKHVVDSEADDLVDARIEELMRILNVGRDVDPMAVRGEGSGKPEDHGALVGE